jgi:hypothetical protein
MFFQCCDFAVVGVPANNFYIFLLARTPTVASPFNRISTVQERDATMLIKDKMPGA